YAEMPHLSEEERLAALPPLSVRQVRLSAIAAMERAEQGDVSSIKLTSLFGRPAWRIRTHNEEWLTVFADTGEVKHSFSYSEAEDSIGPFLTADARPRLIAQLDEPDQWTVGANYRELSPLYRVALGDRAGTELYISSVTGAVLLRSTTRTRLLAWAGAI